MPILKRALEIDPNFAAGYQHLGTSYRNLGEGKRAEECFRKAFELRDRVSERERFMIESTYYSYVTREIDKAAQVYEDWYHTYPKDYAALANLGVIYSAVGENLKALETGRTMVKAEPNYGIAYQNLGAYYENLNRLEEAEEVFKEAERRGLSAEYLLENHYELAFLKGDQTAMARMLASAKGKPGTEDVLVAAEADTQAWYGKFKSARKLTEDAVASATKNDARETAAVYFGAASLREAAAGNHQLAIRGAKIALGLSQQRDVKAVAALAMAQSDEVATASTLAAGLNQEYPLDTVMQQYWLPTINAAIALKHDPEGAVRALADVGKLENGAISPAFNVFLCPAYVRGEAYLRLANGPAAAAEFQKFIDNYGLITNFPWGALARLQLARAYALEAQTDPAARDKAIAAYENFLTLWKDADPDVPIYRQAKAEYANLR